MNKSLREVLEFPTNSLDILEDIYVKLHEIRSYTDKGTVYFDESQGGLTHNHLKYVTKKIQKTVNDQCSRW